MKKIWPWLLLLFLLILFCVWSKKDSIKQVSIANTQSEPSSFVVKEKEYIRYTITQNGNVYTLNGNFENSKQQNALHDTFTDNSHTLTAENISIDETLRGDEAIQLTRTVLPHFIQNYTNGKIIYNDNTLHIYGNVKSYKAQHQMQILLNTSTLSSQDHTNVILEKPVEFSIEKSGEDITFLGTFNTEAQSKPLQNILPQNTNTNIKQDRHLVDNGAISFTKTILPSFLQKYNQGKIEYKNETLYVSGMVQNRTDLEAMEKLLSSSSIKIINNTTIDEEALAKQAAEAEARRIAEEKAKQAALEAKKAEEQRLAAEAEARRIAEEKAAKENTVKKEITKLLKIENIEFNVAKGSLTPKGIETVDKLANILSKYPNIKAEIAGHTDSDGSAVFNQKLSQKRVESVKVRLVEKGIDPARLTAVGYGESKPLVPNTSKENKRKNRRVEINIQGE